MFIVIQFSTKGKVNLEVLKILVIEKWEIEEKYEFII